MKAEGGRMRVEHKKDMLFALYIAAVIVLAVIYFSVPERKEFIEFNVKWWEEFLRDLVI
jgi:uncharacterized membrane protein